MSSQKPQLIALRDRREEVIETLSTAFAESVLDEDAFEERVSLAHCAESIKSLDDLVTDLVVAPNTETALAPSPAPGLVPAVRPRSKSIVSLMGGVERKGTWRVPERLRVFTVMGGAALDFREAELQPGVTEVKVSAIMGGVDIIVPPDLAVEADGWAIMGGFESMDRSSPEPDQLVPLLRITGFCLMGGVDIKTRLPGEGRRAARKRRRRERKQLKGE